MKTHWEDLSALHNAAAWPAAESGRLKLFHRLRKSLLPLNRNRTEMEALYQTEKYQILMQTYLHAQEFYQNDAIKL